MIQYRCYNVILTYFLVSSIKLDWVVCDFLTFLWDAGLGAVCISDESQLTRGMKYSIQY